MKRTDQERIERELKRIQKRQKTDDRRVGLSDDRSMGAYVKTLSSLLRHDGTMIYNTLDDEDILEVLVNMKDDLPEKEWEKVIRRAVNSTKVSEKETAVTELCSLIAG
jgi:hypothetical protein